VYYTLSTDDKIVINNERLNVVNIVIPKDIIHKWQKFANLLAEFIQIPAALIMKLNPPYIEVFTSSKTNENPYKVGEKEYFDKSGLYCEHVIKTRNKLLVSNAIKEEYWNKNPDIKLGMISYLGFPLFWPDGEAFGTICVLDLKENHYNENQNSLLEEFKHIIETHLSLLYENCKRDNIIKDYMESEEMLRDNLRRLEDIQHLGKIGYWEFDVNNQQIIWSDQVFRLYERNPSQGPPSAEEEAAYYTPDESKRLRDYAQRAFEDGEKFEYDFQANLPSGKVILLTALMRPIKDRSGHIIKLAGIVQDITDRKLTELKLRESEERYQKAYERAIFYRDLFTHDISNIFNNLNLSSEFISMAQNNYDKLDDLDEVFSVIQNSVERGSLLISNVQKLSQLEDSEVKLQSMDIIKELEESITFLRNSFPNKEFVLEINNPYNKVLVIGNEFLLDIFENLLINAAKHNNNSVIEIVINISKIKKQNKNFIKVEIMDNGRGITSTNKKSIFKKLYKKKSPVKGMGIGLSLVKKIVESFNGKIKVEDRVQGDYSKGSNFILLIPELV